MTVEEILLEIRKSGCELEVYRGLQECIFADLRYWKDVAHERGAVVTAVRKIATQADSPKAALNGIRCLVEDNK